jgi:hypothetical protein
MPLTPDEARKAQITPNEPTEQLFIEIDSQLVANGRAYVSGPSTTYAGWNLAAVRKAYEEHWTVVYKPAGHGYKDEGDEVLVIEEAQTQG